MSDDNEKLALAEQSITPPANYHFRLEDPHVLLTAVAATYLLAVPAAFGWASVALAACVKLIQRVGFIDA